MPMQTYVHTNTNTHVLVTYLAATTKYMTQAIQEKCYGQIFST